MRGRTSANREKQVIFFLFIVMLTLWFYWSFASFDLYFDAYIYDQTQKEIESLQRENILLEDDYLHNSSLQIIEQKARQMGFVDAEYAVLYKDHMEIIRPK